MMANDYKYVLDENRDYYLEIYSSNPDSRELEIIDKEEAEKNGEACVQLLEGCSYEYVLSDGLKFENNDYEIIRPSRIKNRNIGRINTGNFVGKVLLSIVDNNGRSYPVDFEIRSGKVSYREDYRFMLEEISDKCTDLLMINNSIVSGNFTHDHSCDSKTAYQRFAFVKSFFCSDIFDEAIYKILQDPVTDWIEYTENTDIRRIKKLSATQLRQVASRENRMDLPVNHQLKHRLSSVPRQLENIRKKDTTDIHENRFIKFVLDEVLAFCTAIKEALKASKEKNSQREYKEVSELEEKIDGILKHNLFRSLSPATYMPLNSPVLQRKEGYREILDFWMKFEIAAKLIWEGGDDVYNIGKRDVAILYEYWLFFRLADVVSNVFQIHPGELSSLFEKTSNGLNLKLKSGQHTLLRGVYKNTVRDLSVELSYNKTFSKNDKYFLEGSWSVNMRPDFTVSIWPKVFSEIQAEEQELMVHIHFDAKYRVSGYKEIFGADVPEKDNQDDLLLEKKEQKKGIFKRADLLKMHAYKDAIKRTAGAYVLYPGTKEKKVMRGFHEILPGLGAFSIRPEKENNGEEELKGFLKDVVNHILNRTSKREQKSYYKYSVSAKKPFEVREKYPEFTGYSNSKTRVKPASEIIVLVGYCRSKDHFDWVKQNQMYNFRTGVSSGHLKLTPEILKAEYLLLHLKGELETGYIFKFPNDFYPRVETGSFLKAKGYPSSPSQEKYIIYDIYDFAGKDFDMAIWDIRKLSGYRKWRQSAYPFTTTIAELMKAKVI